MHRRIISEVAFIGLPGDAGWLGFRQVQDRQRQGRSGSRHARWRHCSAKAPPMTTIRRGSCSTDSAQHNLGSAANHQSAQPAAGIPASAQSPPPASSPRRHARSVRGVTRRALVFEERIDADTDHATRRRQTCQPWSAPGSKPPTAACCAPRSGPVDARIERASRSRTVIPVDFRPDKTLGLLVPYEMSETFSAERSGERNRHRPATQTIGSSTTRREIVTPKP